MIVNRDPGRRELTTFAIVLPVAVALGGWLLLRRTGSSQAALAVWGVGGALALVYAAVARWRRAIFVGISLATFPIGWVVSHVLLLVIFALVVTPTAMLLRVAGRDPLARRLDPTAATYWAPLTPTDDVRRSFRQF